MNKTQSITLFLEIFLKSRINMINIYKDIFDALAPKYDTPLSAVEIKAAASKKLIKTHEVFTKYGGITLLRTKV